MGTRPVSGRIITRAITLSLRCLKIRDQWIPPPRPHETVVLNVQMCHNTEMITKKSSTWVIWELLILKQGKFSSSSSTFGTLGVVERCL